MAKISDISFEQRAREKEAARQADLVAIAQGRKSVEDVRRANASFAFGPEHARLVVSPAPANLLDDFDLDR